MIPGDDEGLPPCWDGRRLLVDFFFALEYPMAVPEGLSFIVTRTKEPVAWVQANGGFNFVKLTIWRPVEPLTWQHEKDHNAFAIARHVIGMPSPGEQVGEQIGHVPLPTGAMNGTVVQAETVLIGEQDEPTDRVVSAAFDRCLYEVSRCMRAYATVTSDYRVRPITRRTCRPLVPMTTRQVTGEYDGLSTFMVHEGIGNIPYAPDELTEQQLHVLRVRWQRLVGDDPFTPFVERSRAAKRALWVDGDSTSTIIAAYTACEVLLNTTLLVMAWEAGMLRQATRGWFEGEMGFMSRIGTHVVPRLGGNWGTQQPMAPMSQLRVLSNLRHQVVHYGYLPSEQEAVRAPDAAGAIEALVKERLAVKQQTYPRTTLLLLGEPGLRRLNRWSRWMEQWVQDHADQEEDWTTSFKRWRDTPASSPTIGT